MFNEGDSILYLKIGIHEMVDSIKTIVLMKKGFLLSSRMLPIKLDMVLDIYIIITMILGLLLFLSICRA